MNATLELNTVRDLLRFVVMHQKTFPVQILVDATTFAEYEQELCSVEMFVPAGYSAWTVPALMFKGIPVVGVDALPGERVLLCLTK